MPTIAKVAAAAAVLLVIAVVGFRLVPASGEVGGPAPTASPTPAPTATPVPTITGTLAGQGALQPGRYRVDAGIPGVTVTVPAGWTTVTDWVVRGPHGYDVPAGMAVRFYTLDNLAKNPMSAADGKLEPPLGPTVADLVQAIATHLAWTASAPTDITIDGHAGQRVEFADSVGRQAGRRGRVLPVTRRGRDLRHLGMGSRADVRLEHHRRRRPTAGHRRVPLPGHLGGRSRGATGGRELGGDRPVSRSSTAVGASPAAVSMSA